jgi:hypothetical protein
MKTSNPDSKSGASLVVVMVSVIIISILTIGLNQLSSIHGAQTVRFEHSAQAFWLAEAGMKRAIADLRTYGRSGWTDIPETSLTGDAARTYEVTVVPSTDTKTFISTGTVAIGGESISRHVEFDVEYIFKGFEDGIYSANARPYDPDWDLQLRGDTYGTDDGPRAPTSQGANLPGGNDIMLGIVNANGSVRMYDESQVVDSGLIPGNVIYSGDLEQAATTYIEGTTMQIPSGSYDPPDLSANEYHINNDYDIAQIFNNLSISSGRLPSSHPLYNLVVKNPSNRASENSSTDGDDFYFEPATITNTGTPATGSTPLSLSNNVTYYVDGHVWFHNTSTFGFEVSGQSLIVSTGSIHISDNISYSDRTSDLLALVALGQLNDTTGAYESDGNIYFGDPRFGTTYTVDAFMFANNDFLYNTDSVDPTSQQEPETGFQVFGNYMAVGQISLLRDWYKPDSETNYLAASYDAASGTWKDALSEDPLSTTEVDSLRHYAMKVEYDARVRDADDFITNLPYGTSDIFSAVTSWEEVAQ